LAALLASAAGVLEVAGAEVLVPVWYLLLVQKKAGQYLQAQQY
jgi:hypothetical protein